MGTDQVQQFIHGFMIVRLLVQAAAMYTTSSEYTLEHDQSSPYTFKLTYTKQITVGTTTTTSFMKKRTTPRKLLE